MLQSRQPTRCRLFLGIISGCIGLIISRAAATSALEERAEAKIGPGVREAVQVLEETKQAILGSDETAPTVLVAIELKPPISGITRTANAEISSMTKNIIDDLDDKDFKTYRTYATIPIMYGFVSSSDALNILALNGNVESIDLDVGGTGGNLSTSFFDRKLLTKSVPKINADQRHIKGNKGNNVVVAVLDSGVDTDHPNFRGRIINEACFADANPNDGNKGNCPNGKNNQVGTGSSEDDAGHGTHVTGIVAASGSVGGVGVAPEVKIVSIKVTYGPSYSGSFSSTAQVLDGIDYILRNPSLNVSIINMSLATCALFSGVCDNKASWARSFAQAIQSLWNEGVIAFAASGNNSNREQMSFPACISKVISVGNSNLNDKGYASSNSDSTTNLFAPGVNIQSSHIGGGLASATGTSMASPHAAGCAALLIESGDAVSPQEIKTRIETSSVEVFIPSSQLSFPRLDCKPDERPPTDEPIGQPTDQPSVVPSSLPTDGDTNPPTDQPSPGITKVILRGQIVFQLSKISANKLPSCLWEAFEVIKSKVSNILASKSFQNKSGAKTFKDISFSSMQVGFSGAKLSITSSVVVQYVKAPNEKKLTKKIKNAMKEEDVIGVKNTDLLVFKKLESIKIVLNFDK